jgi:Ankyrin repeats (3 copies)
MVRLRVFFVSAVASLALFGCHRLARLVGWRTEDRISATSFSSDPRVRRLAIAVEKADSQEVAAAVQAGGDVNAFGGDGFCLLDWAMARGNVRGFEALLERGASLDALYRDPKTVSHRSYNRTMLERVLGNEDPEFIRAVLRSGLHPDHVSFPEDGRTLLFLATDKGSLNVVDALLDAGAGIDHQDVAGDTPLVSAMQIRNYRAARHLLARGADPTVKDRQGYDFVWALKQYGSRGVRPDHRESFEAIVDELVRRGLLTREDIVEADKPKQSAYGGPPGITVIEHAPDSEGGRAIRELDEAERRANRR